MCGTGSGATEEGWVSPEGAEGGGSLGGSWRVGDPQEAEGFGGLGKDSRAHGGEGKG